MGPLMPAAGGDENRKAHSGSQHGRGEIERAHVAQHPRAQRPGLVGAAVPVHADLIGRASGDIVVFRFRQALLGNGLKIEKIDR